MMLFLHLEVKPLMTLTTVLYLSCALISGHLAIMLFFFFNHPATTEIYTLSLHDALPISDRRSDQDGGVAQRARPRAAVEGRRGQDRKSTRLNSSHQIISYAVFCLKK